MSKQTHRTCVRTSAKEYSWLMERSKAAGLSANAWLMRRHKHQGSRINTHTSKFKKYLWTAAMKRCYTDCDLSMLTPGGNTNERTAIYRLF